MSKETPSKADKTKAERMLKKGAPNYRSKNPMRVSEKGEAVYEYADEPQWKKTTYVPSSKAYVSGAGRGKVNPETVQKKKTGGKVKGYAPGGSVGKGYGKARGAKACKMR